MFDDIVKHIFNCSQCKSGSQFPKQPSDVSVLLSMFLLEPTRSTDRTKKEKKNLSKTVISLISIITKELNWFCGIVNSKIQKLY